MRLSLAWCLLPAMVLTAASVLGAQALSGIVRIAPSGAGAAHTMVVAVGDGARLAAVARADAAGVFALQLGQPGTYRLLFLRARSEPVATAEQRLDSATTVEREFFIPGDSTVRDTVYLATQVERYARARPHIPIPRYPELEERNGVRGRVRVLFIVDSAGRIDERTLAIVGTTAEPFAKAVRRSLRGARFVPASIGGRKVAQLFEATYDFGCHGDPMDAREPRDHTLFIRSNERSCWPAP